MRSSRDAWKAFGLGLLAVTSCGGSDDSGDGTGNGTGTITEQWASFCAATFTADTPILDAFDDLLAGQVATVVRLGAT